MASWVLIKLWFKPNFCHQKIGRGNSQTRNTSSWVFLVDPNIQNVKNVRVNNIVYFYIWYLHIIIIVIRSKLSRVNLTHIIQKLLRVWFTVILVWTWRAFIWGIFSSLSLITKVPTKKVIFDEKIKESSILMKSGTKLEISSLK